MKKFPRRGETYTLKQIETELDLRDAPFLRFIPQKVRYEHESAASIQVIQSANVVDLHHLEGWADTEWVFVRETEEWIPLFRAKDDAAIEALCVIEPSTDYSSRIDGGMHIYPKGTEHRQYEPYDEKLHGDLLVAVK